MPPAPDLDPRPAVLRLTFPASPSAVRENLARMMAAMPLAGISDSARGTAEIVLAEVLNNIAEHAYADKAGPVIVTLRDTARGIGCLVVDQGEPMPGGWLPDGTLPQQTGLALADLPEGGFGWNLIRRLTQDLAYTRIAGANRLSFLLPRGDGLR